ncbi:MAG: methanogenesis marker 6 protein [Methanoregulaceae archaeon]|jgi:putative methanogenesis marker protein 6|nr:methanogenesis marker 6 protein [Methanoregulaceae archaeon]
MTEYHPKYTNTVTKYVFVESPEMTPGDLAIRTYEISQGVMIKETCFGLQITGNEDDVNAIIDHLRKFDPAHIFVKDRGFPPGDSRRCRANLGGARPGYFGHEFEISISRFISKGLEELPKRPIGSVPKPPVPAGSDKLDAKKIQKIIESVET